MLIVYAKNNQQQTVGFAFIDGKYQWLSSWQPRNEWVKIYGDPATNKIFAETSDAVPIPYTLNYAPPDSIKQQIANEVQIGCYSIDDIEMFEQWINDAPYYDPLSVSKPKMGLNNWVFLEHDGFYMSLKTCQSIMRSSQF